MRSRVWPATMPRRSAAGTGRIWPGCGTTWANTGEFQSYIRVAFGADAETAHIEGKPGRAPRSTVGLIAEARASSLTLVTADRKIIDYGLAEHVKVLAA